MSLNLELQPDTEKRLREKAALLGVPLNAYIADLIERDVQAAEHPGYLNSPQERAAAWMAWAKSHKPLPVIADDSRDSIYHGCGE